MNTVPPPPHIWFSLKFILRPVLILVGMTSWLIIQPVHAQTGVWIPYPPNRYVAVDANGNALSNSNFVGTPTGSAKNSYLDTWNAAGLPSYPVAPLNSYGNPPLPSSSTFSITAYASNSIWLQQLGNYYPQSNAFGSVSVNEQGDYTLKLVWDPLFQSFTGTGSGDLLTLQKNGTVPTNPAPPTPPTTVSLLITVSGGGGAYAVANPGYSGNFPTDATASAQISDSLGESGSYTVGSTGSWRGPSLHLVTVGGSTITKTIHVTGQATAQDSDGTNVSYRTYGSGAASMTFVGTIDLRTMKVTCPQIDQSYSKGTPPVACSSTTDSMDVQSSVSSATTDASGNPLSSPIIISGGNFNSNASGFQTPQYQWTRSGDGAIYGIPADNGTLPSHSDSLSFGPAGDLTKPFGKSTTEKCQATDLLDGAVMTGTYAIHWHYPHENFQLIKTIPTTNQMWPKPAHNALNNTTMQREDTAYFPRPDESINLQPLGLGASVFLGVGSAVSPYVLIALGITDPLAGAVVAGSLSALSVAAGSIQAPPDAVDQEPTSYDKYIADLNHQVEIDNTPGSTEITRVIPSDLVSVDAALTVVNNLKTKYPTTWEDHWQEDHYFYTATVTGQGGYNAVLDTVQDDEYNPHGYIGQVTHSFVVPIGPFYVLTWHI